AVYNFATM
nr:Chain E, Pre-glycoprotein polyprotein GP complex [Mammarenavirus choriomeningitidis]3ROO_F Chain F, Pre-glycoprotein polyprotein GP complex [Mammarenavirus choriomeningitidis]3TID_C Chain C, LCMV derived octamer peptide [Mammarenavirus choriomeningitidis]4HS3_C Chain C, Envelope glycoprotein [Mammarenavirus choriomeningitidis]